MYVKILLVKVTENVYPCTLIKKFLEKQQAHCAFLFVFKRPAILCKAFSVVELPFLNARDCVYLWQTRGRYSQVFISVGKRMFWTFWRFCCMVTTLLEHQYVATLHWNNWNVPKPPDQHLWNMRAWKVRRIAENTEDKT